MLKMPNASCLVLATAVLLATPACSFAANPSPDQYKVDQVFTGKAKMPQFKGRDKAYRQFRTQIRDGLADGADFAGHYTIIQFGCGAGCVMGFIVDDRTGRVYDAPRGGEANMYLTLQYQKDSRLMAAQWADDKNSCNLEFLEWDEGKSKVLSSRKVGTTDDCFKDINDNLAK
jgi:hypothetical protein